MKNSLWKAPSPTYNLDIVVDTKTKLGPIPSNRTLLFGASDAPPQKDVTRLLVDPETPTPLRSDIEEINGTRPGSPYTFFARMKSQRSTQQKCDMTDFFRFPHTPHLAWLGKDKPRDDKVMSSCEAQQFLNKEVTLEEKVDGANLGISVDADGMLRIQNRGAYIDLDSPGGQFKPLKRWISSRIAHLEDALFPNLILFGEWCYAVHSVLYTRLPDWFLAFDVYDRDKSEFWSAKQRNALASALELSVVPRVDSGRFSLSELEKRLGQSQITESPAEGLYLRHDEGTRLVARAKLVGPEFTQSIAEHWSKRDLKANLLVADSASANWRR